MGRKDERRIEPTLKAKKRDKKKRDSGGTGIVDVLNCPPVARYYCELVVGNGIGDDAVEDALAAFERAWEVRRQKAHEDAMQEPEHPGTECTSAEHLLLGPLSSKQDWLIDWDAEPMTARTWCWVGYQSIRFYKPA